MNSAVGDGELTISFAIPASGERVEEKTENPLKITSNPAIVVYRGGGAASGGMVLSR